jgi:hypothetical protein
MYIFLHLEIGGSRPHWVTFFNPQK